MTRRKFIQQTSTGAVAVLAFPGIVAAKNANDKVVVAVIGCNGRGMEHIKGFLSVPNVEIGCVCDVDSRARAKGVAAAAKSQSRPPKAERDLRQVFADPAIDAVSIATPDHWHTPAALMALAAGKHVYVEKPGSHNLHESELIVQSARKHRRAVQMGNQRRSWPWVVESIHAVHSGEIGKVFFARAWYTNHRGSIGHGKPAPVPEWLDYSIWQGPAPEREFHDNIIHYNWHWFWHWGTGELGNNGVHFLDLARWGLEVTLPRRVVCGGNRYHFKDDQETPDTYSVNYDFGDKGISWDGQSCDPRGFENAMVGVNFYGEGGTISIANNDCRIYDLNSKVVREIHGNHDEVLHFANFVDAIRSGKKLASEIGDGQLATRLCHWGNIAWRTGHTLNLEPDHGKIVGDKKAAALASRKYRAGWEPKI